MPAPAPGANLAPALVIHPDAMNVAKQIAALTPAVKLFEGIQLIAKVFYTNLDSSTDRRAATEKLLTDSGIPYERIRSFTPEDVGQGAGRGVYYPLKPQLTVNLTNAVEARSAANDLTHRLAYETVANMPAGRYYMIMEDDHLPFWNSESASKLLEALKTAPSDWCMLRLTSLYPNVEEADRVANTNWYRAVRYENDAPRPVELRYYGASGIILTPERARHLLNVITLNDLAFGDCFTAFSAEWKQQDMQGSDHGICPSYVLSPHLMEFDTSVPSVRLAQEK